MDVDAHLAKAGFKANLTRHKAGSLLIWTSSLKEKFPLLLMKARMWR